MILEKILARKDESTTKQDAEVKSQAKAILARPEFRRVHEYDKQMTDEIIAAILQEAKKTTNILRVFLGGKEKPSKISVAILDCEKIIQDTSKADTLRNKFLLAVLESFSKNQSMSNLLAMSNEIIVDDLLLKVLVFLQKIKEKNKVGQQILLVKNFNSLEEKEDQKNIANLLQNDISNSSTCRVVIFS